MKNILDMKTFLLNEENEKFIENEEFAKVTSNEEVIFVQGRFQPMHKGHLNMIRNASKLAGGKRVFIVQIKSQSKESPFPEDLLKEIREEVVKNESFIAGYGVYNTDKDHRAFMSSLVRYVRGHGFEPVGQACGEDRVKDYTRMLEYVKNPEKSDTEIKDIFSIIMADDRSGGYSGTKVRMSLINDDKKTFKECMPEYLWKFYDELKSYMKKEEVE